MRKFKYISFLIIALSLSTQVSVAQLSKVKLAYEQLIRKSLDSAKTSIDEAALDASTSNVYELHYMKANVYKELYKAKQSGDNKSEYRNIAVDCYFKALSFTESADEKPLITKSLMFLASKYNNDATRISKDTLNADIADYNFNAFIDINKRLDASYDSNTPYFTYYRAMGSTYLEGFNRSSSANNLQLSKVYLLKALNLNPNDLSVNKNIGILYYNQGVNIINNLAIDADLLELDKAQTNAEALYKQALPFMLKAYEVNPKDVDVLEGLQGIYHQLNDFVNRDDFKKKLDEAKKN